MRGKFLLVALAVVGLILLGENPTAKATPFFIDQYTVEKNGSVIFNDTFSDGNPPPSAPPFANGVPTSYFVRGTLDEAGGRVRLDTVGANIVPGIGFASGLDLFLELAILQTNIDPANLLLGLKNNATFAVIGLFDLGVPDLINEAYGVRLTDSTGSNLGNDTLDMLVQRFPDGLVRVQFVRKDLAAGVATGIASTLLDPGHDQITLTLTRASATSDAISASFAYIDGGVTGPVTTFGTTADIFHGENFTRGAFLSFSPTPEPSTLLLLGSGLAGAAAWGRRKRRKTNGPGKGSAYSAARIQKEGPTGSLENEHEGS